MRRYLNRDGNFNIAGSRHNRLRFSDLYHSLIALPRGYFLLLIIVSYFLVNLAFGLGFYYCPDGSFEGMRQDSTWHHFADSFFFSVQTLATIGYGRISPMGLAPNLLVTLEAFIGMLSLAVVTGLFFVRFSKPTARVIFSKVALMTHVDGQPCLIFRMANERMNQIVEANVSVTLIRREKTREGERYVELYDLKLERHHSPMFALMWTVIHPIDKDSPLYGLKEKDLIESSTEILVTLTGMDDTVGQTIHARFSYIPSEILWNRRFVDMLHGDAEKIGVYLERIHHTEEVAYSTAS